jgi:uncharacterized protein YdaU (DUF1376 family)
VHYYKRNLGDYAKKAGRLSMLQHGAYTLLIDACYDRESFPTFAEAVDWAWASTTEEVEAVKFVLSKFFTLQTDGIYHQKRIEQELGEYRAFCEKQGQRGKKGGRPKNPAGKKKNPAGLNNNPKESLAKANESLTTNHYPLTTNQGNSKALSANTDPANRIFNYWVSVMGKPPASTKPTTKRIAKTTLGAWAQTTDKPPSMIWN